MNFSEEALIFTQDVIRFFQKFPHQISGAGHRCIHHNDKFFNLFNLLCLLWFDQRHITVHGQSVMIKGVVKAVVIHTDFFPPHRKLSQKFPVVVALLVGDPKLFQKVSGSTCLFLRESIQIQFHLLADLFPVILCLIWRPLFIFLRVRPVKMAVRPELGFQFHPLLLTHSPCCQAFVYLLGCQHLCAAFQSAVYILSQPGWCPSDTRIRKAVDNGLHCDVAGQIPKEGIPFSSQVKMPEQAVQDDVEIGPVDILPVFPVSSAEPSRMKVKPLPVCSNGADLPVHLEPQTGKRHVQVPHFQI